MKTVSTEEFEKVVLKMAIRYQKTEAEIRELLTPEALLSMGYEVKPNLSLAEQIEQDRVRSREEKVLEHFRLNDLV